MAKIGRPSPLDNEETLEQFAEAYVRGVSRTELAELFNVHPDTISRWVKTNDKLAALIHEKNRQRVDRILRKIDSALEDRLSDTSKMDLKDLIAIRRELVPKKVEVGGAGDFQKAELEAWAALDEGGALELEPGDVEEVDWDDA